MPKIMITNDDGYWSPALEVLEEVLRDHGDILVVAPNEDQTSVGRSTTRYKPIEVIPQRENSPSDWYEVLGTPADCVILGIEEILKGEKPDLLVSGINIGDNLGTTSYTISGTLGACYEAVDYGIPAIAASILVPREVRQRHGSDKLEIARHLDFSVASKYMEAIVRYVLNNGLDECSVLNVNFPSAPDADFEVTRLSTSRFKVPFVEEGEIKFDSVSDEDEPNDSEITAALDGKVSITPFSLVGETNFGGFRKKFKKFMSKQEINITYSKNIDGI